MIKCRETKDLEEVDNVLSQGGSVTSYRCATIDQIESGERWMVYPRAFWVREDKE